VLFDESDDRIWISISIEDDVRAMLLKHYGLDWVLLITVIDLEDLEPVTGIGPAFMRSTFIRSLGSDWNQSSHQIFILHGAVEMDNTIHVWMISEDDPLRLPSHRRLSSIGNDLVVSDIQVVIWSIDMNLNKTHSGMRVRELIEINASHRREERSVFQFEGEVSDGFSLERFVRPSIDAMLHDFAE
jgi:hypothetical protein